MTESVNRLSWSELLWGLFFSPRHTAWEFSQEKNVYKRAWQLVIFGNLFACICACFAYLYLHKNYPSIFLTDVFFDIFFEIFSTILGIVLFPIAKWILQSLLRKKDESSKVKSAVAVSALSGINAILYPLYSVITIFIADRAIGLEGDVSAVFDFWDSILIGCLILICIVLFGFYISGLWLKNFISSIGYAFGYYVILLVLGLVLFSFFALGIFIFHGDVNWLLE